ncbi:large transcriptional regulator [Minicystis rosea]|nr:large transcriptional regulator [Minicystis rosea]
MLGREHHLAALADALAASRAGPVTVLVHGLAGMGKSMLCQRFLDSLPAGAVLLSGRCHLTDPTPYRALAPLIDGLADHLAARPRAEVDALVVSDVAALRRIFPALRRVPSIDAAPALAGELDAHEVRRRASAALRALLRRIAGKALVLWVDDLQWADADSTALLLDLVTAPDAPSVLLVTSYRSVVPSAIALVAALLQRMMRGEPTGDVREILVGPLSSQEARALALRSIDPDHREPDDARLVNDDPDPAGAIARASDGCPRFVDMLSRRAREGASSLDAAALRAEVERFAAAHAEAERDAERAEPEGSVEQAADRAASVLAFHTAAALYEKALASASARRPILIKLGHALADAGRAAEAGRAFREAGDGAPPEEAHDLRRRAADQLLRAGLADEGLAAARAVLDAVDLPLPQSSARALASLLYRRARLSLRGLDVEARTRAASPDDRARLDTIWSIADRIRTIDLVRGADLHTVHALRALDAGDPLNVARALASEALLAAMEGGRRGLDRARQLVERARAVATQSGDAQAIASAEVAAAGVSFHAPRFSEAVMLADRALDRIRATCAEAAWDLGSIAASWLLPALFQLGRIDEIAARLPAHLADAEARGALFHLTALRTLTAPRVLLAGDRPGEARREALDAVRRWPPRQWHVPHWGALLTRVSASLYEGDGVGAYATLEAGLAEIDGSPLPRVELLRIETIALRGASAIAAMAGSSEGEQVFRVAERTMRALEREPGAFARPFALELRGALALARGQESRAIPLFEEAERAFGALEMGLRAAAARRRRGEIMGGDLGATLCRGADAWMRDRGIARPDRVAAMLSPAPIGFF